MEPTKATAACSFELPSKYKFQEVLGEGCFGTVVKCLNKETRETVAIKFPKCRGQQTWSEIFMLKKIKGLKLDERNIVKFTDCFQTTHGKAIVFELLDMSLYDYMRKRNYAPMLLSDIRTIIQQMATAFDALKENQVIHTDIKLDNIMMVNHCQRPFEVKLIDFGLAISRLEARTGRILQPLAFRSPEIFLGCRYSQAIDMWTLGCAMFQMICGHRPFSGENENEIMLSIVELLGQPADDVLENGQKTKTFFNRNDQVWRIKSYAECFADKTRTIKSHKFQSLDDLKEMRLEEKNKTETVEREQCVELLKAMLKVDAKKRITPKKVLTHPFITKDYPNDALASTSGPLHREAQDRMLVVKP